MINFYHSLEHKPMTSEALLKRGHCCKTGCLHCPYGFVIKKFGLQFEVLENVASEDLEKLLCELKLDSQQIDIVHTKLIILKQVVIGLMVHNHIIVKKLFLLEAFQSQSISRELVESYFFY